jgi:hypothetical protein
LYAAVGARDTLVEIRRTLNTINPGRRERWCSSAALTAAYR